MKYPNSKQLKQLHFINTARGDKRNLEAKQAKALLAIIKSFNIPSGLEAANALLQGHGVESFTRTVGRGKRAREISVTYVNTGDSYNTTLCFVNDPLPGKQDGYYVTYWAWFAEEYK